MSIDFEIRSLEEASFSQYIPSYLINNFKDDFNENILYSLIKNLDHLIQSIQANNSFKILSLNDSTNDDYLTSANKSGCSLNSSLSEYNLNACKSLLIETSSRLLEIFSKYHDEIFGHLERFGFYAQKYAKFFESDLKTAHFRSKNELLIFQRAILVEKLSSRHYNLLNILYRNVFDFYQKMNQLDDEEELIEASEASIDETNQNSKIEMEFLIERFHKLNKILFDLELFDHMCGDVVVEVVENKIKQHIESCSLDNYEQSFIQSFENWLEKVIIGWIKLIYSSSISNLSNQENSNNNVNRFDQYLYNYKKQLSHFMYTNYAHIRIRRLFDIIIDFPDSKNAVEDLRICLNKTNLRSVVIKSLRQAFEQRLLHPGVNTSDILTAYVSAIKALLCLDSTGVMMENICEPLRKYLRNRDDTVKCIVSNLIDDGTSDSSSNDIMEEFCKDLYSSEGRNDAAQIDSKIAAPFVVDTTESWQQWQPDPIDALNLNNSEQSSSKSNIISMLVNIYGSKDLFVNEYKLLLGDRLLSNNSYNMEKEIRNLELLKLKFGESALFACEAMLKDISESKRINTNILEQLRQKSVNKLGTLSEINPQTLRTLILSEQFWPKLKEEKIEMPPELTHIQDSFKQSYETFKGNRTLIWKNNLGIVNIEIEIGGKMLDICVTPIQAAVIIKFQEKDTWPLQELSQSLKMCPSSLRKKLQFWKMQGLIKEQIDSQKSDSINIEPNESVNQLSEVYTLVKESNKISSKNKTLIDIDDLEESEKKSKSADVLKEEELHLYWKYTESMLRGCGSLPLDRIHGWLKMYANPDLSIEQVKFLVELKTKEQLLKYSAGLYRLNK